MLALADARAVLVRVANRLVSRGISRGWQTWVEAAEQQRRREQQDVHLDRDGAAEDDAAELPAVVHEELEREQEEQRGPAVVEEAEDED